MSGFPTRNATYVAMSVVEERGRWVVYMEVGFWEPHQEPPLQAVRHRIQDYSNRRLAEIAASWMKRAAERDLAQPPFGL